MIQRTPIMVSHLTIITYTLPIFIIFSVIYMLHCTQTYTLLIHHPLINTHSRCISDFGTTVKSSRGF